MQVDNSPPAKAVKRKASKGNDSSDEDESGDVEVRSPSFLPCCRATLISLLRAQMLDVSFDFFDPQPHDYHSIKLLLSQLMSHDAKDLDMGGVADLVLEQKLVGSTVKTDGAEGDPYAVLTVLNLNVHKVRNAPAPSTPSPCSGRHAFGSHPTLRRAHARHRFPLRRPTPPSLPS